MYGFLLGIFSFHATKNIQTWKILEKVWKIEEIMTMLYEIQSITWYGYQITTSFMGNEKPNVSINIFGFPSNG